MNYVMRKLQRGPTLKLYFSVIRQKSDFSELATESINIDNLARVIISFNCIQNNLQIKMQIKKNEEVQKTAVPITIVWGELEEKYFCCDEWVHTKNKIISFDSSILYNAYNRDPYGQNNYYQESTLLYNFEIYITVQAIAAIDFVSIPSIVMKHLYKSTDFTDFQLKGTDGAVPVHKAILTAHSEMFKTMLQREEWTETKESSVNIKDVTVKTLQHLKDYMYLGVLPDEGLESLLLIANCYLMDNLKSECIAKLVKTVKPEDLEDLVEFACQNNMPSLMKLILFQTPDHTVTSAYKMMLHNESESKSE